MSDNRKTDVAHWEQAWSARPRLRFASGVDIGTANVLRLLRRYVAPGLRYIEVGCAPGKTLSWVGREVGRPVCGIDYSPTGSATARWLCSGLGIDADIRCEDAMETTFPAASYDLVFSCGLIEHFDDPRDMVDAHLRLVAPGGKAVIAVPNYSGIYLRLQRWCDPQNLAIHNLSIMNESAMQALVRDRSSLVVRSFRYGRFSPWLVSLPRKLGRAGWLLSWLLNAAAHLQWPLLPSLAPLVVLEVTRSGAVRGAHGASDREPA